MIATSTVVMFGLMYLNTYALEHVFFSETRAYMALLMGAVMAIIMLSFMLNMYRKPQVNLAIYALSAAVFALSLWLVRSQATVEDVSYMRAMIPHHSIAILTSERANISDPRVRRLADEIIRAQRREIAEMKALIADLEALEYQAEPLPPTVGPITGGSDEVPGAPSLTLSATPLVDGAVVVERAAVTSDAWVVLHPEAIGGNPDTATILGKAFLLHGENENVPVGLKASVEPGTTVYAMLHADTGEIGVFEFGRDALDPPLDKDGAVVQEPFTVR